MFVALCFGGLVVAACGGIMGALKSEKNRRRAGSFYQSGSLAFGGLAVFLLVLLADRVSLGTLGWIVAAMVVLPALAALGVSKQPVVGGKTRRETGARIWQEFKSTFLRWEALPYTLLVTFPMCSGAMIGLLPSLAADYGVSGSEVAWMNSRAAGQRDLHAGRGSAGRDADSCAGAGADCVFAGGVGECGHAGSAGDRAAAAGGLLYEHRAFSFHDWELLRAVHRGGAGVSGRVRQERKLAVCADQFAGEFAGVVHVVY